APIPSAASNTLAVIPIPASVVNQPKSYPLKFSESQKSGVGNRKGEAFWIVRFEHPFLCLGNDADARQLLEVTRHHTLPGACTKFGLTQLLGRITIVRDL
ncbi:hypothetical protein, partial [Xanthomonas oryzae]|uniref:hypothetical protein n=1 Tax=Xanthomonas oryzae TaxID=347 RepID=UPI002DF663EE|nr:hypothetical protein [Xanthomonas oryzae pv. oryzicola]